MPGPGTWGHVLAEIFSSEQWLSSFVIFPISLRPSLRLKPPLFLSPHLPQSFFKAESAIQHKTLLFLTLSNSRTEECSSPYAQVLLISMVGSSVDRDQPGLCLFGIFPFFPSWKIQAWVLTCPLVWQSCSQAGSQCSGEHLGFLWSPNSHFWCLRAPSWGSHNCRAAPCSPGQVLTLVWNIASKSCFFKSW